MGSIRLSGWERGLTMNRSFIKRVLTSEYLSFVLRLYVGFFFIYASLSKIPYPAQFAQAVANYRLIPYMFLNTSSLILPWIELVAGFFLVVRFRPRAAVIVIGLLLIMFEVMVLVNMYWGAPITCGCYDAVGEPIGWKKVSENALMLVFCVQIYLYSRPELLSKFRPIMRYQSKITTTVKS